METLTRTRAVFFDFNGTLSDDEPVLERVFTEIFHAYLGWRMSPQDYYGRLAGHSDREIVEMVVSERLGALSFHGPLVERLLALRRERYRQIVEQQSPIRPATEDLVHRLAEQGHALAVVTGAQRADVDFVLAHSSVRDRFGVVVAEEDVSRGKPDPEGFLLAAERLGVAPGEVLVLEDSVAGVRAARAAGMRCVAVTGTHDEATLAAEGVPTVESLGPSLLDRLS
jgi:beta-phosphoglucomutase